MAHEVLPVEAQVSSSFLRTSGEMLEGAQLEERPEDECGVIAVYGAPSSPVLQAAIAGMRALQHRGHSGAGITYRMEDSKGNSRLITHKDNGPVDTAIKELISDKLANGQPNGYSLARFEEIARTPFAIGHVRYSTAESNDRRSNHPHSGNESGIALAHNGHMDNIPAVAEWLGVALPEDDPLQTDSSLLTYLLDKRTSYHGDFETALHEVLPLVEGAYCLTMTDGQAIYAARDPWGFHPLTLGQAEDGGYAIASEEIALVDMGARPVRSIQPGEIIAINELGVRSSLMGRKEEPRRCAFEFIYTARPDGIVDGVDVRQSRINQGYYLAQDQPAKDADVVVGVPNSGLAAASGFARGSELPFVTDVVAKVESTRTFQKRGAERDELIRRIYQFEPDSLKGKIVALVDDSMIKGSTMNSFVHQFVKQTGAAGVHLRFAAAPYNHPCYMGMDTHDTSRLISRHLTPDEIVQMINDSDPDFNPNVLSVAFNTPERLQQATTEALVDPSTLASFGKLCVACATGEYPIRLEGGVVDLTMPTWRARQLVTASTKQIA